MKHILFETDWLASTPVFYNEKTGKASYNINDVIDYANLEFHPEGFNNYLDFGYSILGQTPVKHVKFLRYSSRLIADEQGKLSVEYLEDPVEQWIDYRLSEDDIIDLIRERVREWERSVEGEIIIPTSGGYDSRLLNWMIEDKSRIRSFTYGISENQAESYEVVYARQLSKNLGTRWEQIVLGDFHRYFGDWDKLFGVSTHAHGMYHFEFYQRILTKVVGANPFLSGIIGDAWAGSVTIPPIRNYNNLYQLGYTHGISIDSAQSNFSIDYPLLLQYLESRKNVLQDPRYRIVEAMRFKIILLSYLKTIPTLLGFLWWSPFIYIDIAMAMLNIPQKRRYKRIWQKEFFQKHRLDIESMNLKVKYQNTLDLQALRNIPVRPLDISLLREIIKPDYIEWINRNLVNQFSMWKEKALEKVFNVSKVGRILRRLGFPDAYNNKRTAYNSYCVLLPIENLLKKRDQA